MLGGPTHGRPTGESQKVRTTVSTFPCIVAYGHVMVPLLLWHLGWHQRPTHRQRLVVWQLGCDLPWDTVDGSDLGCPVGSWDQWLVTGLFHLLINGAYWGYNPITNLLLTSWYIQDIPNNQLLSRVPPYEKLGYSPGLNWCRIPSINSIGGAIFWRQGFSSFFRS